MLVNHHVIMYFLYLASSTAEDGVMATIGRCEDVKVSTRIS